MPALQLSHATLEDYYELEDTTHRGDVRHEYFDGLIVAMTGGTFEHAQLASNLVRQFTLQLHAHNPHPLTESPSCQVYGGELKVCTPERANVFYPDAAVVCGKPEFDDFGSAVTNPRVIVEVLSHSTTKTDFETKLPAYKSIRSAQSILYIHQKERCVEVWTRLPSGEWAWYQHDGGAFEVLGLSGVVLDVDGLYQGVLP